MTGHPDVALPAAMVEAAARALHEYGRYAGGLMWEDLDDHERESYRTAQGRALAAALNMCEVREEWSVSAARGGSSAWSLSREGLANWVALYGLGGTTYHRRLGIKTPAEPVDTEGAS